MANFVFPSSSNGFIPEATGQVIQFIRAEDRFPLNRYVQYVPTPKTVGFYTVVGRDEQSRIVTDAEYAWQDGDKRPRGDQYKMVFKEVEFRTFRRDYPWTLGYQTIEQAEVWKPKLSHMGMAISKAMTNRTNRVVTLMQTAGNWGTQTASANTLNSGAGNWVTASDDPSSPNYLAIYKSIIEAARRINLATNGVIRPKDMQLVVSPGLAIAMAETSEMTNYVRESPAAMQVLKEGLDPELNRLWSLPNQYKGFPIVVEDTPLVTARYTTSGGNIVEATTARTYAMADTSAALVSRVGGLDGEFGSPAFSTLQIYHYGGLLEVQAFDDPKHRRVDGHVTEDIKEILTSEFTGFLITGTA